jgi:MFS family permease
MLPRRVGKGGRRCGRAGKMRGYLKRVQDFGPDVKLFLAYNLLANVGYGVTELIFNLYLLKLGFREDYIGEWRAVQTICMAVSAAFVGFLLTRFGTWRCIVVGFSLLVLATLALAIAENRLLLLVLAGVYGASLAFLFSPLMPFILEWAPAEQRQHVAAVSFSIVSFSVMIGSLVGGFAPSLVAAALPGVADPSVAAYRWALAIGTSIAAVGLVPLFLMGEPRRARASRAAHSAEETAPPAERRRVRRDMGVFILAGGIMSIGVGMVQPFYNVFLERLGASDHQIGYVYALGGAAAAIVGLGAPALAGRVGALRAVVLLRLAIVPIYLPLIFVPGFALAVAAYVTRQITISMAWPIDSTFIGELLPPRARAGIYGLRSAAWNFGFAAASFVGGRIIVESGYRWTFVSIVVFTSLAAVTFFGYYSRHPRVLAGKVPSALPRGWRAAEPGHRPALGTGAERIDAEAVSTPVS